MQHFICEARIHQNNSWWLFCNRDHVPSFIPSIRSFVAFHHFYHSFSLIKYLCFVFRSMLVDSFFQTKFLHYFPSSLFDGWKEAFTVAHLLKQTDTHICSELISAYFMLCKAHVCITHVNAALNCSLLFVELVRRGADLLRERQSEGKHYLRMKFVHLNRKKMVFCFKNAEKLVF